MKVFISWSGALSQAVAECIRDWLPNVLQSVEPYFTPSDLEKGGVWATEISHELAKAQVGILCVTRENVDRPWLLFEAGALSKQMGKTYVCPVLFDIKPIDIAGPLAQFQASKFERDDFQKLICVVNERLEERKIPEKNLNVIFEKFWPDLERDIGHLLESTPGVESSQPPRDDRELLEEILQRVRTPRPHSSIFNAAIHEIMKHHIALHDEQSGHEGDYQSTLDSLQKMHAPLAFLIRNASRLIKPDEARRFNDLSYKVKESETPIEFEDNIPF